MVAINQEYLDWEQEKQTILTNPQSVGIPVGGTPNQVLAKNSNTNYDAKWVDPALGGEVTYLELDGGNATSTYGEETMSFDMGASV